MRERVAAAIEKRLEEHPDDEHLQMQATLVQQAQITTIDSFCLNVIRSHFDSLDIDPSFRIGDEGELMLLRGEVMDRLLEDSYRDGGKEFTDFVETYASGKGDYGISDVIQQVYTFSQSHPWPKQWFDSCRAELDGRKEDAAGGADGNGNTGREAPAWGVQSLDEISAGRYPQTAGGAAVAAGGSCGGLRGGGRAGGLSSCHGGQSGAGSGTVPGRGLPKSEKAAAGGGFWPAEGREGQRCVPGKEKICVGAAGPGGKKRFRRYGPAILNSRRRS